MAADETGYQQTLDYLYSRLPLFSRTGAAAYKKDLTNTVALCEALGNPQDRFRSIHVAGTNGKGSTSHALAAALQRAGYRTGLYTSPHLIDFRERIRIDGVMIARDFVVRFTEQIQPLIERLSPSFFEVTVAMAFAWFAEQAVDVAVIETGLGGRLDSTNVITPELSVITHIGYDHTDMLGTTLPEIAAEKAGIIKPGVPAVIGRIQAETTPVFEAAAGRAGIGLVYAPLRWQLRQVPAAPSSTQHFRATGPDGQMLAVETDLQGAYQAENLATVLTATEVLATRGWRLSPDQTAAAFRNIAGATGLRGRYEVLQQHPLLVADVAHNTGGLQAVLQQFSDASTGVRHIVAGFVRDKDVAAALRLFPKAARYYWCHAAIPRALPVDELHAAANETGLSGTAYPSVAAAVAAARQAAAPEDAVLITGSFFVVGEALAALEGA